MKQKTGADYARTYRNKQREKVERYEAALDRIANTNRPLTAAYARVLADQALYPKPALHIEV